MKQIRKEDSKKSNNETIIPLPNFIGIPNTNNNNIKKIKKFDFNKLSSLLDDLVKKDFEYDLIIQGYKEKINNKKRENNILMKEIKQINKDNEDMIIKNKKLNFKNDFNIKEKKIEANYKKKIENVNMINIKEKYNQEINKNKEIKEQINKIKQDINTYKNRLKELEIILNKGNCAIEKEDENMKKFLNEL